MSIEIHFDIACDNPATLVEIRNELPQAEIEFHSGLGGLETVGTIVLPGLVLALQAAAWIREWRKKEGLPFTVVEVHVYPGDGEGFDDGATDALKRELSRRIRALANETPAARRGERRCRRRCGFSSSRPTRRGPRSTWSGSLDGSTRT